MSGIGHGATETRRSAQSTSRPTKIELFGVALGSGDNASVLRCLRGSHTPVRKDRLDFSMTSTSTSTTRKRALITGITGQDGSYLAEFLLEKGYEVHGIVRRSSSFNTSRIDHLYADPHINGVRMFLHYGDLSDSVNLVKLLYELKPDEIYHLAAQSHVRVSFDIPEYTSDVTGVGTIRILEAIRETGIRSRFYQASSSEMLGKAE